MTFRGDVTRSARERWHAGGEGLAVDVGSEVQERHWEQRGVRLDQARAGRVLGKQLLHLGVPAHVQDDHAHGDHGAADWDASTRETAQVA